MTVRYPAEDGAFASAYPRLFGLLAAENLRLRSYLLTGDRETMGADDGGSPRIVAVSFDGEEADAQERRFADARLGGKPKKRPLPLALEVDYGNGYMETLPFTLFRDDEDALLLAVRERSLYLFRSLYGYRKGK